MSRPLLQKSVIELEEMFKSAQGNVPKLLALAEELKHRSTPKAASLQKHVNAAIAGAGTPFNRTGAQPTLKPKSLEPEDEEQSSAKPPTPANSSTGAPTPTAPRPTTQSASAPRETTPPTASATQTGQPGFKVPTPDAINSGSKPTVAPSSTTPSTPSASASRPTVDSAKPAAQGEVKTTPSEKTETLSVEEAYRVLKCAPGSSWEVIEQNRRDLVQQAHPANLANLSASQRETQIVYAKRVNLAHAVLLARKLK